MMPYIFFNFIYMWFNTEQHNWYSVDQITYCTLIAKQIWYFTGSRDPFGRYISNSCRWSTTTQRCCDSDLLSTPLLWLGKSQTHVVVRHSPSNLGCLSAAPPNKKFYPYRRSTTVRFSFLRKCVVARCQFGRAPGFPVHIFFHWNHTDSWSTTNTIILPQPPLFFWGFYSRLCVQV